MIVINLCSWFPCRPSKFLTRRYQRLTDINLGWVWIPASEGAVGWQEAGGEGSRRHWRPPVTGDGRVGVTRYDSPCLGVSQEFRLADQGRQDRCSQPSVSCHTRSQQKTKYVSHTHCTGQTHIGYMLRHLCCMWSLTPPRWLQPWCAWADRKWCGAEFNFSIISIILAVTG